MQQYKIRLCFLCRISYFNLRIKALAIHRAYRRYVQRTYVLQSTLAWNTRAMTYLTYDYMTSTLDSCSKCENYLL